MLDLDSPIPKMIIRAINENQRIINIELEPEETFILERYVKHLPQEGFPTVSGACLLELAVVLLHHTDEVGQLLTGARAEAIRISEQDLLVLRELVPAECSVGNRPIGLSLHRKLYEGLLRCYPDQAVELHFGTADGPSKETISRQLQELNPTQEEA